MAYEEFIKANEGRNIDSMELTCPECGGDLDYRFAAPEEEYYDGYFVRTEQLECCKCEFTCEARQIYRAEELTFKFEEE